MEIQEGEELHNLIVGTIGAVKNKQTAARKLLEVMRKHQAALSRDFRTARKEMDNFNLLQSPSRPLSDDELNSWATRLNRKVADLRTAPSLLEEGKHLRLAARVAAGAKRRHSC